MLNIPVGYLKNVKPSGVLNTKCFVKLWLGRIVVQIEYFCYITMNNELPQKVVFHYAVARLFLFCLWQSGTRICTGLVVHIESESETIYLSPR